MWLGRPFFWMMPRRRSSCSKPLRPPLPPEVAIPLSVSVEAGAPWRATAARKVSTTMGPLTRTWAVTDRAYRAWSSSQDKISVPVPPASGQWVKSDCQHWFGIAAANRMQEDLGRLRGWGMTMPRRVRYRLTVAGETVTRCW